MIQGPTGTSDSFKNAVNKFKSKGKSDLQARRIVASSGIEDFLKKKKRKKK